jgi:hypothetical protein
MLSFPTASLRLREFSLLPPVVLTCASAKQNILNDVVEYLVGSIGRDRRSSDRDDDLADLVSSFHVSVRRNHVVQFERAIHSRCEDSPFDTVVDERDCALHRSFIARQAQGLGTDQVEHHVEMEFDRFDPQIVQRRRQVLAASDAAQNQVTARFDDSP